jgi:hypothetical protein
MFWRSIDRPEVANAFEMWWPGTELNDSSTARLEMQVFTRMG